MNYRKLPKSTLQISEISFGCMSLDLANPENESLLKQAYDSGINYFDTADLYDKGANEELVGKALKPFRKEVIIATKGGNEWLSDGSSWQWNPSKEYLIKAVENSLKRLQTDYIDLYQLHGGTMEDPKEEVIEAFEELIQSGKIRHYGISSIRPNVINYYAQHSNIASNMLQYSLLDRRPEEQVLTVLESNNVGAMARGALAKGLLAGKASSDYLNHQSEGIATIQNTLKELSSESRTAGQTSLKYVLANSAVTSAVVGIRTIHQLQDAIGSTEAPNLTTSEIELLQSVAHATKYEQHRI